MIKTFNITKEYSSELEYLEKQYNQSRYLCELIRADMQQKKEDQQIVNAVKQALQGVNPPIQSEKPLAITNSNIKKSAKNFLDS